MLVHPDAYFSNALVEHRRTIESTRPAKGGRGLGGEPVSSHYRQERSRRKAFRIAHT